MNAFLTSLCAKKIWTTLGPEFGDDVGKKSIIVRVLYGLKSAGSRFGNHIETVCAYLVMNRAGQTLAYGSRLKSVWTKALITTNTSYCTWMIA